MRITLISILLFCHFCYGQETDDGGSNKIFETKDQMIASMTFGKSPMNFLQKENRLGSFSNISYNSQWLMVSFGYGDMKLRNSLNTLDTVRLQEIMFGASFPIKRLALGHRTYDINGFLMLPIIAAQIGSYKAGELSATNIKLSPMVSFQFPYIGIDLKMHTNFTLKNQISGLKKFSLTPEIALKFDGLYNLLDPQNAYVGHAEGEIVQRHTSYSTQSKREGDYIITTTTKSEWTEVIPYSFDRYINDIGTLVAIGPYYTFQSQPYAGTTKLFGIAYHLRYGAFSTDAMVDAGTIGFGDQLKEESTFQNPDSKLFVGLNKEKFRNIGHYNTQRAQVRLGMDVIEAYVSTLGGDAGLNCKQVKFTRLIGGLGFGYATVSAPRYDLSNGEQLSDSDFEANSNLLSVSANHPKFARNGAFTTLYLSFEAGALSISLEANRYFNAQLANTKSISVSYMFPYNRIRKKMFVLKSLKN